MQTLGKDTIEPAGDNYEPWKHAFTHTAPFTFPEPSHIICMRDICEMRMVRRQMTGTKFVQEKLALPSDSNLQERSIKLL